GSGVEVKRSGGELPRERPDLFFINPVIAGSSPVARACRIRTYVESFVRVIRPTGSDGLLAAGAGADPTSGNFSRPTSVHFQRLLMEKPADSRFSLTWCHSAIVITPGKPGTSAPPYGRGLPGRCAGFKAGRGRAPSPLLIGFNLLTTLEQGS